MKKDKKIIKNEKLKDIIFDYHPKSFSTELALETSSFLSPQKETSSHFKIADIVAVQRGIVDAQQREAENKIEELTLQRIKGVEEKAYKEAYDLGLIEGREQAFSEKKKELEDRLNQIDELLNLFENIKKRLFVDNEHQLMKLLVYTAGKVAIREIETDPESILKALDIILEDVQKDEIITIFLSQQDYDFLDQLRIKCDKRVNYLRHIKLEVGEHIRSGGCEVKTNYGVIDSTLEQRVERVMSTVCENMPRIKKD